MSYRPPSSPSPGPHNDAAKSPGSRQSLGVSPRGTPSLAPGSPRPGARPTSELLPPNSGMFQTPEAEALDQWFENLQNYEQTLEEMAAASLDVNFKEELSAIEQWFKVLSEAERTAALYSLLQHSTQVQIRFFITVLQQMARSDPMTALLSPAMGGSMQSQMEAKLASIKSPGLKSGLPASPTARNFSTGAGNRQSLAIDASSGYLSPESAALGSGSKEDAAGLLAQQRAKLKASNAAHRISAPVLSAGTDGRAAWGPSNSSLSQVAEQNGSSQDSGTTSRPKSSDFSGSSPRATPTSGATGGEQTITTTADNSWASMVNTPLIPMFQKPQPRPEESKGGDWSKGHAAPGVPRMGDPTIHRRRNVQHTPNNADVVYDDNGNVTNNSQGRFRNNNNNNNWGPGGGARNPSTEGVPNLNMGMPFGMGGGMASPINGMMGMNPISPFGVNMNVLSAMGLSPEAQIMAAQLAASGFGQPGWGMGLQGQPSAGLPGRGRNGPPSGRSTGMKSATSVTSHGLGSSTTPKGEEDVDPALLNDIPAWLRSLRLHKYTPNFEGVKWQDMVLMDEAQLEAKGVAALGARRKMLKTFELVRKKMGIDGGPPSSLPPSATLKSP